MRDNVKRDTCLSVLLLSLLAACRNPAPLPATSDMIERYDPIRSRMGRRVVSLHPGHPLLEQGFAEENRPPGVKVTSEHAVIVFDSPFAAATEIDLTFQAAKPTQVFLTLNGRRMRPATVGLRPSVHAFLVKLAPTGNRLVLSASPAAGVRLLAIALPPTGRTVTLGNRRVRFLPAPPPSSAKFRVRPSAHTRLEFDTVSSGIEGVPTGELRFEVRGGPARKTLFSESQCTGPGRPARPARPVRVDLAPFAGKEIELLMTTRFSGSGKGPFPGTIGFANPRLRERPVTAGSHPSLILWLTDTLRADVLGCYGNATPISPFIDRFSREGTLYQTTLAESSWTRPSVASLFTGMYPFHHGAIGRADALSPRVRTLAERLHGAGYETAAFAANVNVYSASWGLSRGFAEVFSYESGASQSAGKRSRRKSGSRSSRIPSPPFASCLEGDA